MSSPLKVTTFLLLCLVIASCSSWGSDPTDEEVARYTQSPNYRPSENRFVNRNQAVVDAMWDKVWTWENVWKQLFSDIQKAPPAPLPEVKPDFDLMAKAEDDLNVIWFGHSSFLLDIGGRLVLVDPLFGNAGPFSLLGKRFQQSAIKATDLPKVDVILISHDHYDHLEMNTVRHYADTDIKFVVPLGVGRHLVNWGVNPSRITELDWWQDAKVDGLQFVATPSQHYSGRRGFANNDTLWASWVVKSEDHAVFFSGDSAYDTHFTRIGEKHGPFDIAFLENGQYNTVSRQVHMFPEDAIQAFEDLGAEKLFPVHWGMFALANHAWDEPIREIDRLAAKKNIPLIAPKIGQIINIDKPFFLKRWWEAIKAES